MRHNGDNAKAGIVLQVLRGQRTPGNPEELKPFARQGLQIEDAIEGGEVAF
jgi:hypothetical protein